MADDACMEWTGGRADGRTGADEALGRTGAERVRTVEQTGGRGPQGADTRTGRRGTDGAQEALTGPNTRGWADGRMGGRADWAVEGGRAAVGRTGQTGRRGVRWSGGRAYWQSASRADGRTDGRADERVGLGLKGHIPRGWVHSWAPSPLASSECKCAGCLGVQWGPVRFHVKHPYFAPGLTCLV